MFIPAMPDPPESVMVLLSGGLDSLAVMAWAQGAKRIEAVTFNYGQRHWATEREASSLIAESYGVPHYIISLLGGLFTRSPLIMASGEAVPQGLPIRRPNNEETAQTYVPRRNTVLLACAAALAEQHNIGAIAFGPNAEDENYPDCSASFCTAMGSALIVGSPSGKEMMLYFPFLYHEKFQIINYLAIQEAPVLLTHTCYLGEWEACGTCDACQERLAAFKKTCYKDPIEYAIEVDWEGWLPFPTKEEDDDD